jgi:hypothetical protein
VGCGRITFTFVPFGRRTANLDNTKKIIIALVLLVAAGGITYWNMSGKAGPETTTGVYFYDLSKGELFAASSDKVPPFQRGGGSAVRAHVFVCAAGGEQFIGFLEKFGPQAQGMIQGLLKNTKMGSPEQLIAQGQIPADQHLVASPDAPQEWHPAGSQQGRRITAAPRRKCNGGAKEVKPGG